LLRDYEDAYGFDLEPWRAGPRADSVAFHPFPASVRARRLAVAVATGQLRSSVEIARAARAIVPQLEFHLLGNHLVENGLGLVAAGAVTAGLEADVWFALGSAVLEYALPRQFLSDGGHSERSASYHLWLVSGLLECIALTLAGGREVRPRWLETAAAGMGWARAVRAPDGTFPLFNDATLDASPTIDAVLGLGAALGISASTPGRLDETGWIVASEEPQTMLVFDVGPDGDRWQPGHVHADALAFELWIDGARAVVDFGVSSYVDDEARRRTRSTLSHNTVELAGADSSEVWSSFRTGRRARARLRTDARTGSTRTMVASHDGYRALPGSPVPVRTLTLRPGHLDVHDVVEGAATAGTSRLRVAAGTRLTVSGANVSVRDDVWYPRFAAAEPARVYEQPLTDGRHAVWALSW
jgi:hypothetical protein